MSATVRTTYLPMRRFRWLRYSLRTLLLFVTACALACSWLAVRLREAKQQRAAAEELRELGGEAFYDNELNSSGRRIIDSEPPSRDRLRDALGENPFHDVVKVTAWDDEQLQHIRHFPRLESLDFYCGIGVTDAGMENLKYVPRLRELRFGDRQVHVTAAGLACLRYVPKLRRLELRGAPISDQDVKCLEGMKELENLSLEGDITDAGLVHLRGLSNLKELDISTADVTDAGVQDLQRALPNCKIECPTAEAR